MSSESAKDPVTREQLEQLVQRVEQLEARIRDLEAAPGRKSEAAVYMPRRSRKPSRPESPGKPSVFARPDFWINRVGLGLLLLGLLFLFKYSIDQGWLGPAVRLLAGLLAGSVLLGGSFRVRPQRRAYRDLLAGGGLAAYYITGYAAYELYRLVPAELSFAFLAAVSLAALLLADRRFSLVIGLLGVIGGLGAPFLLHRYENSIPLLVGYTALFLGLQSVLYWRRSWKVLFSAMSIGGWLIAYVLLSEVLKPYAPQDLRFQVTLYVVFCGLLFGGVPVLRKVSAERGQSGKERPAAAPSLLPSSVVGSPLLALGGVSLLNDWSRETAGGVSLGTAALYLALTLLLRRIEAGKSVIQTFAAMTALLAALGLIGLLDGESLAASLCAEGLLLHWMAKEGSQKALRWLAHTLYGGLALWLLYHLVEEPSALWPDLFLLAAALFPGLRLLRGLSAGVYLLLTHLAFLAWLYVRFAEGPAGQGIVSGCWGVYALLLLLAGLRFNRPGLRQVALVTGLGVLAKLFLVDLQALEAIWRVLLFMGFGGSLLLLGYFFPALWQKWVPEEKDSASAAEGMSVQDSSSHFPKEEN